MMRALPYSAKWALTGGCECPKPSRVCMMWRWIVLTLLHIDAAISCSDWLATCNSSLYVVNLSLIASNTKGHSAYTLSLFTSEYRVTDVLRNSRHAYSSQDGS